MDVGNKGSYEMSTNTFSLGITAYENSIDEVGIMNKINKITSFFIIPRLLFSIQISLLMLLLPISDYFT